MKNRLFPDMYLFENGTSQKVHIFKHSFQNYKLHSHDFYELEYICEGSGMCEINGKEYPFQKGDVVFVTPLDIHGYKGDNNIRTLTVNFKLANLNQMLMKINCMDACITKSTSEIQSVFDILIRQEKKDTFYDLLCEKLIETILILFLRNAKTNTNNVIPKEIYLVIEYINQNFKDNITLKSISEYAGYSQEHFCRQFKKYTGASFLTYLTELRVTYAKHLLDSRKMSVTQVCYESGFGCLQSFRRAFKKKYGHSPKQKINQNLFPKYQKTSCFCFETDIS